MTLIHFPLLIMQLLFVSKDSCVITGNVSGFPDSTMIYLVKHSGDEILESTFIINNNFQFEVELSDSPEELSIYSIIGTQYIYTPLLLGNEKVNLKADISDFPWNVEVKGSKFQDEVNELNLHTKDLQIKRDSLVNLYYHLSDELKAEKHKTIWDEIGKIDKSLDSIKLNYIKSHPNSYASILQLGYMKSELPKDSTEKFFKNFSIDIKDSKYGKQLKFYLNSNILKVGDEFYDFEALNTKEENVRFSTLRKNYSLLEFTMTHCMPCKQALKELRELNQSQSDSLSIVSFSIDTKKETWLNAFEEDSINWISLWDGKGYYGKTPLSYGVNSFPTFVLIDKNGRIIDTWRGYKDGSIKEHLKKNHFAF